MAGFRIREFVVPPGGERRYIHDEWRGALVVVEKGNIEIESLGGVRLSFQAGAVLFLAGLRIRFLRNRELVPAVLTATSRRMGSRTP